MTSIQTPRYLGRRTFAPASPRAMAIAVAACGSAVGADSDAGPAQRPAGCAPRSRSSPRHRPERRRSARAHGWRGLE